MSNSEPRINFSQMTFPSDALTIQALRKVKPHHFDLPAPPSYTGAREGYFKRRSIENLLGGIIDTEREIAEKAYYAALGRKQPDYLADTSSVQEAIEYLGMDYVSLGLATGENHARELIRAIESQATAQARLFLGPTPPR